MQSCLVMDETLEFWCDSESPCHVTFALYYRIIGGTYMEITVEVRGGAQLPDGYTVRLLGFVDQITADPSAVVEQIGHQVDQIEAINLLESIGL